MVTFDSDFLACGRNASIATVVGEWRSVVCEWRAVVGEWTAVVAERRAV